ncbi:MAG: hypothetical protein GQ569_08770 [Methylococcaceae bacterium]|nr:hypothetical protein [Methylococcaceae bacterium]
MDKHKKSLLISWILLVIYSVIIIKTVYNLSHAWPNKGSFEWFLLIFFCPPFLYHFTALSYGLAIQQIFPWKKTLRLVTLILGFLLAGNLLQYAQKSSLRKFNRAYQPMIELIEENLPNSCDEIETSTLCKKPYLEIPKTAAYNNKAKQMISREGKPIGELLYNEQRFMLHFMGGSVDIDGSTIFYDSEVKQWQIFHNDNLEMMDEFNFKRLKLTKCEALK